MWSLQRPLITGTRARRARYVIYSIIGVGTILAAALIALLQTQLWLYQRSIDETPVVVMPFPIGVDPAQERIVEQPNVSGFFYTQLAGSDETEEETSSTLSWVRRTWNRLAQSPALQQLASPVTRIVVIWPGDRREEVVDHFGDVLRWDQGERERFASAVAGPGAPLQDGVFFPDKYIVSVDIAPEELAGLVRQRFEAEILSRYTPAVEAAVPLEDTLVVASLLEREARDFSDMRIISGVIWNRLFADMKLQLDASLQYVKGSRPYGPWWPKVHPRDKFLDSPFNTYQHAGLPPQPIANPSPEAVLAALNPRQSDCLYYFHDDDQMIHCSAAYDEHVQRLRSLYGRGR